MNDGNRITANPQILNMIDRLVNENPVEYANINESLKKGAAMKSKDIILETMAEYQRRGNFFRIFPAKNSDCYDAFFSGPRPYNKMVYRVLYSDEVLRNYPGSDLVLQKPQ